MATYLNDQEIVEAPTQSDTNIRADASDYRAAFLVGLVGWTLDACDFFLVVFLLTTIARDFHQSDGAIALSLTATLACRPIGGLVFGLLSDRYGRKKLLIANLVLYSLVQLLTGMSTTFVGFLLARATFGVVMGGQWGVGTSLAMEKVPLRLRGLLSGLLQQGYALGYLIAGFAYALFSGPWGWRILFVATGVPAILTAIYLAFAVRESAAWEKGRSRSWVELSQSLKANWKLFVFLVTFMLALHMSSHGTQDMYPTYLERQWGFAPWQKTILTAVAMVGAIAGGLLFGHVSDRVGRRRSIMLALGAAICLVPLWAFAPSVGLLFGGAFLLQFCVQGAWGVVPAYVAELSPASVRAFLPGFANQCGVVLASGIVYVEATFAHRLSYARAMAICAVVVFFIAILVTALGKENPAPQLEG
ncbi:MAG TPA: MFS transporter [Terriglobales bacterium]|jgi:SHS family lactate transporter-like MFS transporter|nr:MFS transporter [Terriglobales bacterium]